jgi:hypothetical protein
MEYLVAFSPELEVEAADFVAAWNEDGAARQVAEAVTAEPKAVAYLPPGIDGALVFLAGVASTVAVDVLKDVIKNRVNAYLAQHYPLKPKIEVTAVRQPNGAYLLVVKEE